MLCDEERGLGLFSDDIAEIWNWVIYKEKRLIWAPSS